jgi:hypothetical protein
LYVKDLELKENLVARIREAEQNIPATLNVQLLKPRFQAGFEKADGLAEH